MSRVPHALVDRSALRRAPLSRVRAALALLLAGAVAPLPARAQEGTEEQEAPPSIEEKSEGMTRLDGFFDLYWDDASGKLYWEIDRWDEEFLYQVSLPTGLGSNPVGLDRGQLGGTYVLRAERVGPKVLLVEPNYRYRARSDEPAEVRAVREAFAPSTHWGFEIAARTGDRALVDATEFFLRDAHGIARTLKRAGQGTFRPDASRSAVHLPRTKAFPRNTEVEVSLTFTSEEPGRLVRETAATGEAVTLRQHHSLVELPDGGYEPRAADPRVGAFGLSFHDYARPIEESVEVRWVARHRLEKADPSAERSPPVEPIVYYLDPGVPQPIRSALIEGASWWNQAFEAAGYVDAFRVEVLPEGADPMDLRYNVIHWTHRSTRGWSYGSSVVDPRTGEILKGNVNLGSLRLRQDHLIATGLGFADAAGDPGPFGRGPGGRVDAGGADGGAPAWRPADGPLGPWIDRCDLSAGPTFDYLASVAAEGGAEERAAAAVDMALARIRQLSAHEVGHTLGLAHNFIASTYGRASVMDYPAPLVRATPDGGLDLSEAYDVGIGEYDRFAIRWLYSDLPADEEEEALDALVEDALARGIRFISDADARPAGAAHPLAHLWDNGADPVATLRQELEVRRLGIERFGPEALRDGEPLSAMHGVFVPLYLHHRYQVEAAVRSLGGADYAYAVRGDGQTPISIVPAERQREALAAVLETLSPRFLAVPERVLDLIPPAAFASAEQERFESETGPTFDPIGVAARGADHTVGLLLHPARMARLVEYHARDPHNPGAGEVLDRLLDVTWRATVPDPYRARVAEAVQDVVLDRMMAGASGDAPAAVRAVLAERLDGLAAWLEARPDPTPHQRLSARDIRRWQERPWTADERPRSRELPPGSPIGARGRP